MKAEDLMIGDWVYVKVQVDDTGTEPVFETTPKRVTELTKGINGIYVEGTSGFAGAEITPIPLTPEILEKNGFELYICAEKYRNSRYYECADWNIGWCIHIYPLPDGGYYMEIDSLMDRYLTKTLIHRVISSVHELQHGIQYGEIEKEVVVC